ncbi:Type 2A phosphatase-associated protein 42 [Friedmanniomyces endolithicus]|uniref:Type 2A phosphatase-associated protein 42 n=3 Tax=Dothideomycetidae TaxID=451867 RepID=A0AAN6H6D7_9PEZI|nr:Type 2A phosphatase-associated protein 42 [Friedmanniomyces endolithicus]KAK5143308.1 Type 2A phosphatase-associated protein 42 [Rachicladosporium monterosium]KAK0354281.1 Type 2A phosphatase-associated protein 42 [Friedmanniomyces endolithicus]KAK0786493.1 Type 2A phosphatase-associated protein 42 [Friedmanniomyces endolithicus]KAK0786981.1 Type 2A phosphatase-associated protein 42 [Friedmanniomyces endolithicus]
MYMYQASVVMSIELRSEGTTTITTEATSIMSDESRSLRSVYTEAEEKRTAIESSAYSNSSTFQENLLAAIHLYEECVIIANRVALFSPNESLEDIATADLQFLLLNYHIAELILRINGQQHRKANLQRAQQTYERYLKQLDQYDILGKDDAALLEQYQDSPNTFSTASTVDAAARRDAKIKRFRAEKALKQKLEYMRRNPSVLQNDEAAARELHLTELAFCTHQTFQALESVGQELHILSLAPPSPPPDSTTHLPQDARERNGGRNPDPSTARLDAPLSHLSAGMRGPLLDTKGKPLRPFTLTSKRQEFANGVFRPDHSLPTMSIDEYLEEERKRGGMIEGGGPQSAVKAQVDEDDVEAADRETMKAREWDEYVEVNPKGSGNTLNRG